MKKVAVLDVGGTISSYSSLNTAEFYNQRGDSINSFIEEFGLSNNIQVTYEFFSKKISHELTTDELLNLARKIQEIVNKKEIFSLVISIGTNALEDIAFFVELVVKTEKIIVFTGAHFPQNHLVYDGKKNLFNALIVAQSDNSRDLGVVITFNDTVVSSKWATKCKPGTAQNFASEGIGVIGYVVGDVFHQMMKPIKNEEYTNIFSIENMIRYPKVGILYAHFGIDLDYINYLVYQSKIEGLISAGFGKGYQTKEISLLLKQAIEIKEMPIVRCSRSGFFLSNKDDSYDNKYGFINTSQISPQKASVLLSVCLAHKLPISEIKKAFYDSKSDSF